MSNHALQEPLDGTVGGALDPNHDDDINLDGQIDPAGIEDLDEDAGQPVGIQPSTELDNFISESVDKVINLEEERSSINADIKAIVEEVVSKGINRHAFKLVLRYSKMDEKQREGIDFSYNYARKAIGHPVQADMFSETD